MRNRECDTAMTMTAAIVPCVADFSLTSCLRQTTWLVMVAAGLIFLIAGTSGAQAADPATGENAGVPLNENPLDSDLPIIVELFSSQACVFCPQADRFFGDLVEQSNIIGLSCHVDYFDVKKGSLAQEFCTARQTSYAETLGSGPVYTPQAVVQGYYDVVGYRFENLTARLRDATDLPRHPLSITREGSTPDSYQAQSSLPQADKKEADLRVWVALFDKPHKITIASGRNAGQAVTYKNIVSDFKELGSWPGGTLDFRVEPTTAQAGFVFAVQDRRSGRILAADRYMFPDPTPLADPATSSAPPVSAPDRPPSP